MNDAPSSATPARERVVPREYLIPFMLVSSLFLLWGFCNGMIDVMDKHFQNELGLTKSQSARVQFAHYLGYFLMALPAGWLATKLGYKGGIIAGLLLVAVGGFWFIPATQISEMAAAGQVSKTTAFMAFLVGVCAIASGLTFLETIANPYTTVLGSPRYAATRINLAQSLNGIGWILGPIVGSLYFYAKDAEGNSTGSETLYIPYVAIAIFVLLLAGLFAMAPLPDIKTAEIHPEGEATEETTGSLWSHRHFIGAVVAQFFYVAAQAGIFAFFVNYMTADTPPISQAWAARLDGVESPGWLAAWLKGWFESNEAGVLVFSDKGASNLMSLGFVLFLLGRFSGTALLKKFKAHSLLTIYGVLNVIACILIIAKLGWLSVACVFLSFFLMSIMFPTIFALGIHGLGGHAKQASAFIVMAIMGGAVLPPLMGFIADHHGMSLSFAMPAICFAIVAAYGFLWPRLSGLRDTRDAAVS
jgi:FHS family L-fucose permease-like MFS transporter